ncbi:MAG: tripartite tricarboxylate transporter substrate binding protein [Betaproteobacteria bacterium]|nr:tripartite tricarboxylate transporter substrate binding protein [Betaproteobacteria bacterium]
MQIRRAVRYFSCVLLCGIACAGVLAQEWKPQRPLRLIVPFPPGGTADLLARLLATPMGNALGQQIVVDNRGGAGGVISMDALVHAPPDGYTFGIPSMSAHAANATLIAKLPYDSIKDFLPLTFVAQVAPVLVVHPSNPATSVQDLISRAKAAKKQLTFGSSGTGVSNHIAGELLRLESKADMAHVPYKGGGAAMVDVMSGQIDMMFNPVSSVLPFINSGRLRAIGISDRKRSPVLPNVPTMEESGFANFYILESWGLVAPVGTPPDAARRLRAEAVKVLSQPDIVERYAAQGLTFAPSTPERLREIMVTEVTKYRDIIQRAGIKAN